MSYQAPLGLPAVPVSAQKLCRQALMSIGRLGGTEPLDANDLEVCFEMLNGLIDSWKTNELMMDEIARSFAGLTPNTYQYNVGPGGHFSSNYGALPNRPHQYPEQILWASLWIDYLSLASPGERWLGIPKTIRSIPADMWRVPQEYPDTVLWLPHYSQGPLHGDDNTIEPGCGVIFIAPRPLNTQHAIVIYWPLHFEPFISTQEEKYLRPGLARALRTNLAMEIAPLFDADPSDVLRKQAKGSYDALQIHGSRPEELKLTPDLIGRGLYNIYGDFY